MRAQDYNKYSHLINTFFLFRSRSNVVKQFIQNCGEVCTFARDEIVEITDKKCVGMMLEGKAKIHVANGSDVLLKTVEPGDVFGAAGVFLDDSVISSVIAKSACKVLFFSKEEVAALIQADPLAAKHYIVFLCKKIEFLNSKIADFTGGSTTSRLASYLLETPESALLNTNMSLLSKRMDIGRASIYRSLETLINEKAIEKDGKAIIILNRELLEQHL